MEGRQHTPMFFFFFQDMFEVEKEIVYSGERADCQHIAGSGLDSVISKRMLDIFFLFFWRGQFLKSDVSVSCTKVLQTSCENPGTH